MASTGIIHGFVTHHDGSPAVNADVFAYPSVKVVRDAAQHALRIDQARVKTTQVGEFTLTLTASDDLSLDPHGVTYTVKMPGIDPVKGVFVPTGGVVEMADVTPVDPDAPQYAAQVGRNEFDALAALVGSGGGTGGATFTPVNGDPLLVRQAA